MPTYEVEVFKTTQARQMVRVDASSRTAAVSAALEMVDELEFTSRHEFDAECRAGDVYIVGNNGDLYGSLKNPERVTHWIVNMAAKRYVRVADGGGFFNDDWKAQTPFVDSRYADLLVIKARDEHVVNEYMVWDYDLCRDGMIVGVYFDKDFVSKEEAEAFVRRLKSQQDVVSAQLMGLKRSKG